MSYLGNAILQFTAPSYPRLELQAQGAGVAVNGELLPVGERRWVVEGVSIELRDPGHSES